eukprot:6177217-Pleurochrysis_carterae.AAC.1
MSIATSYFVFARPFLPSRLHHRLRLPQDSEAEHDLFPFLPREKFGLLRLSPRAFLGAPDATTPQSAATRANESLRAIANGNGDGAPATAAIAVLPRADEKKATQTDELRIGFLGHGGTPTNYLAVRLENCSSEEDIFREEGLLPICSICRLCASFSSIFGTFYSVRRSPNILSPYLSKLFAL